MVPRPLLAEGEKGWADKRIDARAEAAIRLLRLSQTRGDHGVDRLGHRWSALDGAVDVIVEHALLLGARQRHLAGEEEQEGVGLLSGPAVVARVLQDHARGIVRNQQAIGDLLPAWVGR